MGVFARNFNGLTAYGHSGFWGTRAVYIPEMDLAVAAAITQQESKARVFRLVEDAVELIRNRFHEEVGE